MIEILRRLFLPADGGTASSDPTNPNIRKPMTPKINPNSKRTHAQRVATSPPAPVARTQPEPAVKKPLNPGRSLDGQKEAGVYLDRIKKKVERLAEEFATGAINRDQFQELFDHYHREQRAIEAWIELAPDSDAWQRARTEGRSIAIRRKHMAKVIGYAIYKNSSGMPIATVGEFKLDASLIVPMLSSYRSAAREIFGSGVRSSQIEDGKWLCFVPGQITTLMALFTTEPAGKQLEKLDELHRLFELANRHHLQAEVVDPDELVLPHRSFVDRRG
jgi:hypothetical protein